MRLTPAGLWAFGRVLPCSVGRGGVTTAKREGDGATPRGVFRFEKALFRRDKLARPQTALALGRPLLILLKRELSQLLRLLK